MKRTGMSALRLLAGLTVMLVLPALGQAQNDEQKYPDVVDVEVTETGSDRYRFAVTLSSPYDTPERYADAFRVKTPGGEILGVRELLHHHANEQPFTRSLNSVQVPAGVAEVTVEGRDMKYGYGGKTMSVAVPGR